MRGSFLPLLALLLLLLVTAAACIPTGASARASPQLGGRAALAAAASASASSRSPLGGSSSAPLDWSYGENNYTLSFPFTSRQFFVYVPASYREGHAASLVVLLHGRGGQARGFARDALFQQQAEKRGFVLLYPQGSMGPNGTAWNGGLCCVHGVDDVGFIGTALSAVWNTFTLREDSVHVTGFSNGGYMTERLACTWPFIASAASVSGNTILNPGLAAGLQACDIDYIGHLSMLHIHGDADTLVPWDGAGAAARAFPTIPEDAAAWARRNRCKSGPVQTLSDHTFTNEVWSDCAAGSTQTVELVRNHGGGHVYPMDPAKGIVTTAYIIDFFDRNAPEGL